MKNNVTYKAIKTCISDLRAQLEWIEDSTLRAYNTPENKKEIKVLRKSVAFLEKQLLYF